MDSPSLCPKCHAILLPNTNFCPTCGYQIAQGIQKISIGRQIYVYCIAFFLPPFGLVWAFKYLKSASPQQKKVAWIIIGLTVISLLISIWIIGGFFQGLQQQFSDYSSVGL